MNNPKPEAGKIHICRPMNLRSGGDPKTISIELERGESGGRRFAEIEVPEEHVAKMLLGSMQVRCTFTDWSGLSQSERGTSFLEGAKWAAAEIARHGCFPDIEKAAEAFAKGEKP